MSLKLLLETMSAANYSRNVLHKSKLYVALAACAIRINRLIITKIDEILRETDIYRRPTSRINMYHRVYAAINSQNILEEAYMIMRNAHMHKYKSSASINGNAIYAGGSQNL